MKEYFSRRVDFRSCCGGRDKKEFDGELFFSLFCN